MMDEDCNQHGHFHPHGELQEQLYPGEGRVAEVLAQ